MTTFTVPDWPFVLTGIVATVLFLMSARTRTNALIFAGGLIAFCGLIVMGGGSWHAVIIGVAIGILLHFLRENLVGIVIAGIVIAGVWFVGWPWLLSRDTVQAMYERSIHQDFLGFGKDNINALNTRFADVKARSRAGEMNQAEQGSYGLAKGRSGWTDQQNEMRAHLANTGTVFGDFGIPVTHHATASPQSWFNTGKQVCGTARIKIWGQGNSDSTEPSLEMWTDARGWIPGLAYKPRVVEEDGLLKPYYWRQFPKVWAEAPYMAVLVRVGLTGEVAWEWEPIDSTSLILDVESDNGCQALYMQVNDFSGFANGFPQPEMFARNRGTQPFALGNLRTEGYQAELTEIR